MLLDFVFKGLETQVWVTLQKLPNLKRNEIKHYRQGNVI